jgi:cytochrome d ubiquinol oxidase subunit II
MDLAVIWFALIAFLFIGYAVLDGFDLGVGMLHLFARNDRERSINLNAIAPVWDGNEVWLITAGGALFAAFPPVYATLFSGFYLAFVLLLAALIFRAVSFEFVHQFDSQFWRTSWHRALGLSSFVITLLLGVAFGNVIKGIPIDQSGIYTGDFLSLLNPYALFSGIFAVILFFFHGLLYMHCKVDGEYQERLRNYIFLFWRITIIAGVIFLVLSYLFVPHFSVGTTRNPLFWLFSIAMISSVIFIPAAIKSVQDFPAFVASCVMMSSFLGLFALGIFPKLLPSSLDLSYSLTTLNSSSSPYTLRVMLVITLIGMPLVIGYSIIVYRFFKGKVTENDGHY